MSVQPEDFLQFAEDILKKTTEINCRNAAGRAYYAMHLAARRIVPKEALAPNKGSHEAIIDALFQGKGIQLSATEQRKIAALLKEGKRLRVKADYEINAPFPASQADTAIAFAQNALKILAEA